MDLTAEYENGTYIPNAGDYIARWEVDAQAFRDALGPRARLGVKTGDAPRNRLDLYAPNEGPKGLLVFIHGGYWRRFDRSLWSHFAAGPLAAGWAVAMPSYTLAPEAAISRITEEVAQALTLAAGLVAGPIVITGHSAGGHLSARMRCEDVDLPPDVAARIARIVPISPVSDLRPLIHTQMNADLRLSEAEAVAESPVLATELRDIPTDIWVGAEERPAFLDQARWLTEAWPDTRQVIDPGRHHFDVIDGLKDARSPLCRTLFA
ncbi:MAG: alpha/beta hydrolase [Pseudomonadota bacterium]